MKKTNRLLLIVVISIILILIGVTQVWADPNSSKGFATFGDEESHQQTEELIKEQETNVTEVKSSDNYLSSLSVEGYTLTPEFDKQTLSYTIKEEVKTKEIKINAKANNEKATINGAGTIKIEAEKNSYLVEVTAENGTVRTYTIKLKENTESNKQEDEKVETTGENLEQNDTKKNEQDNNKENKSNNLLTIGLSVFAIVIFLWYCYKKVNRKKRRNKRH